MLKMKKIIGTIVKLDCDGSQGISGSPPRITLNEAVTPANNIGHDGLEPDTTGSKPSLEGVTSKAMSKSDIQSVQNAEVTPSNCTATDVGPVKQKIGHKLHPLTPVTPTSTALKGVTPSSPALQSTEGVTTNTKYLDQLTPANPVLGATPKIPSEQSSNMSETASLGTNVTLGNDTCTKSQLKLPDLVVNRNKHVHPVLSVSIQTENSAVTPANVSELDFPALSSEEDNGGKTPTHSLTVGFEQTEVQLMEEEDDAVINA